MRSRPVTPERQERDLDPLSVPAPEPAHFRPALDAWVLSRYEDVVSALRESRLCPISPQSSEASEIGDPAEHVRMRAATSAAFSAAKVGKWKAQMEPLAHDLIRRLATDRPVDVVRGFAEPWCLDTAAVVTGINAVDREVLAELARQVSAASAEPSDPALQSNAALANAELEKRLKGVMPMRAPAFVALSQTLPCFLGNAWLALLRHRSEFERLRADPALMPLAVDELLRYAGLARSVFRRATASLEIGGVTIAEGERVALMLASADRDAARFPEPDRLDISRHLAGQVALGAGPHSCVGALLIRMAAGVATEAFIQKVAAAEIGGPIEWRGGSGFRSPVSLYVWLQRNEHFGQESGIAR